MKKAALKIISLMIVTASVMSFSGCLKDIDVSRLVEEPFPFEAPEAEDWEEKIMPPEAENLYQGAYIDVSPAFGDKVRIKGIDYAIQLIFEAYTNPDKILNEEASRKGYKNSIKIYNRKDQLLGAFEISSDFLLHARADKDSPLFLLPEYSYYMIEYALWKAGGSLVLPMEEWERIEPIGDERATYDISTLELRLEHDIKTILIQRYGLSEAYFTNHTIYRTAEYKTDDRLMVRVYAFMGYAGFSMHEQEQKVDEDEDEDAEALPPEILFGMDYHFEKAIRLIYTFVDGKYFRLTDYTEHAEYNDAYPSTLESRIRSIFPYEYTKKVLDEINNPAGVLLDLNRQALDYLRLSNQGDIEIDD